jgi:hypothetical protein
VTPDRALAIDRDEAAIKMVEQRWPGVNTICGDLCEERTFRAVANTTLVRNGHVPVHFCHMDLMGPLTDAAFAAYTRWVAFVDACGVFGVTYLRGREMRGSAGAVSRTHGTEILTKASPAFRRLLSPDYGRAFSHLCAINGADTTFHALRFGRDLTNFEALQELQLQLPWTLVPVGTHCYRSEHSPMGVLLTQRMMRAKLNSSYRQFQFKTTRNVSSVIPKDPMGDLIAEADSLLKDYSKAAVCEILDVEPSTLSAYRAHLTRGTYA